MDGIDGMGWDGMGLIIIGHRYSKSTLTYKSLFSVVFSKEVTSSVLILTPISPVCGSMASLIPLSTKTASFPICTPISTIW